MITDQNFPDEVFSTPHSRTPILLLCRLDFPLHFLIRDDPFDPWFTSSFSLFFVSPRAAPAAGTEGCGEAAGGAAGGWNAVS